MVRKHKLLPHAIEAFTITAIKRELYLEEIQLGLIRQASKANDNSSDNSLQTIQSRKGEIKGRTHNQNTYISAIFNNDITFGIGPAGTGKNLAVACAIDHFEREMVKTELS